MVVIILVAVVSYIPIIFTSDSRAFQEVDIPAEGYDLRGYISFGTSADGLWVVLTHGNRKEGQGHLLYQRIRNNIREDVSVLAIDFRGYGESTFGRLSNGQSVLDRSEDIEAAVGYLRENYGVDENRIILLGHSLGAVQVLNVSKHNNYRGVIAIGPGDFNIFIGNRIRTQRYIDKFERNTGVRMSSEVMITEALRLTPESLFSSCPETPIALVFGTFDNPETLLFHRDRIPEQCETRISWVIIPFSGHMYGTETILPEPFRFSYTSMSLSLLKWRLNNLLVRQW
jgi:hypothetical protein